MNDKNQFIKNSVEALENMYHVVNAVEKLNLDEFKKENTVLILVDVINGFVKEGALSSPRVKDMLPTLKEFMETVNKKKIQFLAFRDCHEENAEEFRSYPEHCLRDSKESEIVDELKDFNYIKIIDKNSINGFLEEEFQNWLKENEHITNFIVIGDCTDICIMNFAVTLKCYFNAKNKPSKVIVPIEAVETFHLDAHDGDLMNLFSLFSMMGNGIDVVKIN